MRKEKSQSYLIAGVNSKEMKEFIKNTFGSEEQVNADFESRVSVIGMNEDTHRTNLYTMDKWNILSGISEALDYLEKPWKFLDEINFVTHVVGHNYPDDYGLNNKTKDIIDQILVYICTSNGCRDPYYIATKILAQIVLDEMLLED